MATIDDVREVSLRWMNARNEIVKKTDAVVGLTLPSNEAKRDEFVRAHNQFSTELVNLLNLHDPVVYEAFMELVINGRSIVNQVHVVRGT